MQCGLDRLAAKAEEIHPGTRNNSDLPYGKLLEQLRASLTELVENEPDASRSASKEEANG